MRRRLVEGSIETSVGGRVFGVIAGLVCAGLALGSASLVVDAWSDLSVSVPVGRAGPRARLGLTGWTALLYGLGALLLTIALLAATAGFGLGAGGRSAAAATRTWALLHACRVLFIAGAAIVLVATIGEVLT